MGFWRGFFEGLSDTLFPPSCLACRAPVASSKDPFCELCALTIEEVPPVVACPQEWKVALLVSPFAYGGALAEAIVACKHGKIPAMMRPLTRFAVGCLKLPPCDLIVPVPLHRRRLIQRGFNQACIIAAIVSRWCKVPWAPSILQRTRDTPPQGGLRRAERAANVAGAFDVALGKRRRILRGRRVLLVDDVWTTGATCNSCAATLLRAGAAEVVAFTLCRVYS